MKFKQPQLLKLAHRLDANLIELTTWRREAENELNVLRSKESSEKADKARAPRSRRIVRTKSLSDVQFTRDVRFAESKFESAEPSPVSRQRIDRLRSDPSLQQPAEKILEERLTNLKEQIRKREEKVSTRYYQVWIVAMRQFT